MTVIYLDSVWLLNALVDYFLLLGAARLAGIPLHRGRCALAAALGGVYAAAVFLPGCGFLFSGPVKAAVGILLVLVAFGGEERLGKLTLLTFLLSCALAGCVTALSLLSREPLPFRQGVLCVDVDAGSLLLIAGAVYLVLTVAFRAFLRHAVRGEQIALKLCIAGKTASCTALQDTGNSLRDSISGEAIPVVSAAVLRELLPRALWEQLTEGEDPASLLEPLRAAMPGLSPRLLPYRAVGVSGGMLLCIRTDWLEIGRQRRAGQRIAVSPTSLGEGCGALCGSGMTGGSS